MMCVWCRRSRSPRPGSAVTTQSVLSSRPTLCFCLADCNPTVTLSGLTSMGILDADAITITLTGVCSPDHEQGVWRQSPASLVLSLKDWADDDGVIPKAFMAFEVKNPTQARDSLAISLSAVMTSVTDMTGVYMMSTPTDMDSMGDMPLLYDWC